MKRIKNFAPYEGNLPYASEIFGVYQPMLGWRSKRMTDRLNRGFANDTRIANNALLSKFVPRFALTPDPEHGLPRISDVEPAMLEPSQFR
ncbi:MAG TPA: hypothetical protein VF711_06470, partial [Acidimicrobiales bacterium]